MLIPPASADALPEILLIGPGRLGRSLRDRLVALGQPVRLIGRGEAIPAAPLTYLTVPDAQIAMVATQVPPGGVLLHASGATPVEALAPHPCAGSLHPLMSFPGPERAPWPTGLLPAAVDGHPAACAAATALAWRLGMTPFTVQGDRRLYHAAAVLSGNFAIGLLAAGARLLGCLGVPAEEAPRLLLPLAAASLENAARIGPAAALTGPLARGDLAVLAGHRAAIGEGAPELLPLYEALLDWTQQALRPTSVKAD
jgi:predicted short-subunit dehydrogenase-like oxidoreductase (DUF2520 family)